MAPIMIRMLGPIVHSELMIKSDCEDGSRDEKVFNASSPSGLKIKRFSQPVEGLTKPCHMSAAEKAGISESDVKVSVHRGMKKLFKIVKDGEG